jgi:hypothetical protein
MESGIYNETYDPMSAYHTSSARISTPISKTFVWKIGNLLQ